MRHAQCAIELLVRFIPFPGKAHICDYCTFLAVQRELLFGLPWLADCLRSSGWLCLGHGLAGLLLLLRWYSGLWRQNGLAALPRLLW